MKRAALLLVVAGLAAAALLAPRTAAAYVRYTSASGSMFKWPQRCVMITTYPDDLSAMMTRDEVIGAVDASAAAWGGDANSCTYLQLDVASSSDATPHAINDSRNNVIFRTANWCKLMASGDCDPAVPYDPAALALTTVSASTSSGTIRDADIEVNAKYFNWADPVMHPELSAGGRSVHDLQNALTHEMGHLIGLDHTCFLQPPAPLDNRGNPIPDCADASPEVLATTMFPSANPGDVDKRTLEADDKQAVCDIYPIAQDPMTCSPQQPPMSKSGCDCAAGGAPRPAAGALFLVVVGAVVAGRARRRRG